MHTFPRSIICFHVLFGYTTACIALHVYTRRVRSFHVYRTLTGLNLTPVFFFANFLLFNFKLQLYLRRLVGNPI